jgi:uncharacterized membrane protein YdjX (TVP38/TMEM64 family)
VLEWTKKSGAKGVLVMFGLYAVAIPLFLPIYLILTFSCGMIWSYYGFAVAAFGQTIGAFCSFIVGRLFFRR